MAGRPIAIACLASMCAVAAAPAQSGRPAATTGTVSGRAVDTHGTAISDASVTLENVDETDSRATAVNSEGTFTFDRVPPGRYVLAGWADGYLKARYGEGDSNALPDTPIRIEPGATVPGIVLTFHAGGTIAGTVSDETGAPYQGRVAVFRATRDGRVDLLDPAASGFGDANGHYAIEHLPEGAYLVELEPRTGSNANGSHGKTGRDPLSVAVATFYPAATSALGASSVMVGDDDQMVGIDIQMALLPAGDLTVAAASMTNASMPSMDVVLASTDPARLITYKMSGESPIVIPGVVAGEYRFAAEAVEKSPGRLMEGCAAGTVLTTGAAADRLALTLEACAQIGGRLRVETPGAPGGAADATSLELVNLIPVDPIDRRLSPVWARVRIEPNDPAVIALPSVMPGRYVVRAGPMQGPVPLPMKSVTIGGQDVTDLPIEIHANETITDMVVTLAKRLADLSGVATGEDGRPMMRGLVVVFPRDERYWIPGSRRIQITHPDTAGGYAFHDLPGGEYQVALAADVPGDRYDVQWLRSLAATAAPVTLKDGAGVSVR